MSKCEIVILGGWGDGAVVAQCVRDLCAKDHRVSLAGFLNDSLPTDTEIDGGTVLGRFEDWVALPASYSFIAAVHKIKDMEARARRITGLKIPAKRLVSLIHPSACVAYGVEIGPGAYVGPNVVIQPGARIGAHASLRGGANVGHDAQVGDFAYMGPNSTLCGRAVLDKGAQLGASAVVLDGKTVGRYAVVGLGSAVTKNVDDRTILMGVPAIKVGKVPVCAG